MAMPRTPWYPRLAALVTLLSLVLGAQALIAPSAGAAGFAPVSGSGSFWSAKALDQWRRGVSSLYGMPVNFSADGLTNGRDEFRAGQVDFAVSDIPYGGSEGGIPDPPPARAFGYLPIVAGATAFMYNLKIGDQRVTNLRLSGETIAKIFTREITTWADPAIKAENPGLALPARSIVPVVHADSSGPTEQFTSYLASQYPAIWDGYCHRAELIPCGPTSRYPLSDGIQAKAGSRGVVDFVAQDSADGAITYVENSYARSASFPVVKVLNAADYYVEPTFGNVGVALLSARLRPDLTQDLTQVYTDPDPRAYPLSSYSYMIIPKTVTANFSTDKGRTLSEFAYYFLCEGQRQAAALGYTPLPVNLVQNALDQVNQIPGATQRVTADDMRNCHNPTLSADGTDLMMETVSQPPPCDFIAAPTQCAAGTGGATTPTVTTTALEVSPGSPSAANTIETLTATISPPGVAGSVQFEDDSRNIGGPVAISRGSPSTTTTLAPGTHSLTAVFTPTDPAGTRGSISAAVSAVVSAPPGAKPTATSFMVTPSGTVIQGTPVILVAQVTPANASGTVQFKDDDTELGTPRPVIGGFALTVTSKLTKGTHSLTAVFTPANQEAFGPSIPAPASLTVIGLS